MTRDLTQGTPVKQIIFFAVPLLLGMVLQQLYSVADSVIVGKILGAEALAAIGASGSVSFFVLGFCAGLCNGFAVLIAQRFGAKDETSLRRFFANSIWLCVIAAVLFTSITLIFCDDIMGLMKTPEDIIGDSCRYIKIIFAGIPAMFMYNLLSGAIRSLGDSKSPLLFLAVTSVLNIVLDIVFISVLKTGVAGAGLATVISQGISGIACLAYILRRLPILKIRKEELRFDKSYVKKLCYVGIPAGLQTSVIAVGTIILQSAINQLGTVYVAAISAAQRIINIFVIVPGAIGTTMATYAGQNIGAGRTDRLNEGMKAVILIGAADAVLTFAVLTLFAPQLSLLFVNAEETELIGYISQFVGTIGIFYFLTILGSILMSTMQGMGYSRILIVSGISEVAVRCVFSFFFIPMWGYTAACFVNPTAWVLADMLLIPSYFYCVKRLRLADKYNLSENTIPEGIKTDTI